MKASFLAGLVALLTIGCAGYHLGPTQNLPYRSVAVPMFKNKTLKPQLEAQVTNAIIKRFQSDGTLRIEAVADADVVVTGEITRFSRRVLRSVQSNVNLPWEYRITIEARIEARLRGTGEVVLKPVTVEGHADTFIGSDLQSADEQVLPLIADDLAKRVVPLLAERW